MHWTEPISIDIQRNPQTRIHQVDFDSLTFGAEFTDHMLCCDFRNGQWQQAQIIPYGPFQIDPSAKVFHYGQAIFEGMKAYRADDDSIWLFRPDQNLERFNKSAVRLAMPEVPADLFLDGLRQLIQLDAAWVKGGLGNALYIRPFMIATGPGVIANPSTQYRFMILLSPARSYYSGEVKVLIAEHYSRAANGGIGAAKAAGNYSAQFYPTQLAQQQGFQQVIWTDDATHTQLEESGTMNVFFRFGNTLRTAPVSERILDGVTRKSLIALALHQGMEVHEAPVLVSELLDGMQKGQLQEIFGAGTAAVVNPIAGFAYQGAYYELPKLEDAWSLRLKTQLTHLQYKIDPDPFGWTWKI